MIALILPNFTTSTAGPTYSAAQLTAAALVSIMLYGAFMFVQTVRHRDYFLAAADDEPDAENLDPPTRQQARVSLAFLLLSLAGKHTIVVIEHDMQFIRDLNAPVTVLHQGSVLTEGYLDQVKKDPKVIEVYLGQAQD